MTLQLVYATHATTTDNEARIATGWLPGKLSAAGRRQAAELGRRWDHSGINAVYVSDLKRAVQTAAIAFAETDIPVMPDIRLRECNYGLLNGMPVAQLEGARVEHIDQAWPHGESYRDVVARTQSLLADLVRERDGQRVLLIGHSANQFALEHLATGADLEHIVARGVTWQPGWEYRFTRQQIDEIVRRSADR